VSFEYGSYLALTIFLFVIFSIFIVKIRNNYFSTIKKFWFFDDSKYSKIRLVTFLTGFFFLFIATLDLRGPEERIKATIPDQKTIIIIDSSASMLAEDVRPNRFQRSLFLARHFIKRAAGHQIAVVLFSDTQKRLVPFTDDIDLLDARVAALEKTNLNYGNSNINQAVKESLQYFKIDNDSENIVGNILLFTDSEEHGGVFPLDEGSEVNLAVVGVGTLAGAPIPLRTKNGVFLDYKKHKGEKVISKLNESAIKSMGKDFKNFKYWISTSYTIPTDDILSFFKSIYKKKLGETDIRIRPVYGHFLIGIFIILYFLSSLFSLAKSVSKPLIILCYVLLYPVRDAEAQIEIPQENVENKLKSTKQERKLKNGKASPDDIKFLAQEFLKSGKHKEASILYEEINQGNNKDLNSLINLGTSYASSGNLQKALDSYERAIELAPSDEIKEKLKDIVRNNTLLALQKQKQKNKQDKKDKKEKDKKEKKDKKDKNKKDKKEGGSGKDSKPSDKKDNKKDQKSNKNQKPKDKEEDKKNKEKEDKKKTDKENKKEQKKPSNLDEKEKQIKQKRKLVKIPAMLKQIMDQDRNLQEKYYNTTEKRKNRNRESKDW
tara:strand:+ start:449816 stop:451627 length:1812 start_codon:yes stop_codon:yes gene_type:complete